MADAFEHRARQLSSAMRLLDDDLTAYATAVALLAVHAAIAYNDAVLMRIDGRRVKEEDHRRAASITRKICGARGIEANGLKHLEELLAQKSGFAYGERIVSESAANKARSHALRFETWALRILGGH